MLKIKSTNMGINQASLYKKEDLKNIAIAI